MQNRGGITDIILQEMTWLIILMTVRGQLLSHVNERGLRILFFLLLSCCAVTKSGKKQFYILLLLKKLRILLRYIFHLHQLICT